MGKGSMSRPRPCPSVVLAGLVYIIIRYFIEMNKIPSHPTKERGEKER